MIISGLISGVNLYYKGLFKVATIQGSGFHLGFFVWGGRLCAKIIVCEACKVFEPIFEYQSPMHKDKSFYY